MSPVRLAMAIRSAAKSGRLGLLVFCSPVARAPPEERWRHRLATNFAFIASSGWWIVTDAVSSTVESTFGLNVQLAQSRCTVLYLAAGGLDITGLTAFILFSYGHRMTLAELTVLLLSCIFGIAQAMQSNLLRAAYDVALETIRTVGALIVIVISLIFRALASILLAGGCPAVTWVFAGCACSVLFVEVPIFLIWLALHGRSIRQLPLLRKVLPETLAAQLEAAKSGKVAGDMSPKAVSAESALDKGETTDKDGKKVPQRAKALVTALTCNPLSEVVQRFIDQLNDELGESLLNKHAQMAEADMSKGYAKESEAETRTKRQETALACARQIAHALDHLQIDGCLEATFSAMVEAGQLVDGIAFLLRHKDGTEHDLASDMVRAVVDEHENVRLIVRSVELTRSYPFRYGTLGTRAAVMSHAFPSGPEFCLVHWQTLQSLGTLPAPTDLGIHVTTAQEAYRKHHSRAIVIAAVCDRGVEANSEELAAMQVRQMVGFAIWYRKRWGRKLEPYFWIDSSCLPDLKASWSELFDMTVGKQMPQSPSEASTPRSDQPLDGPRHMMSTRSGGSISGKSKDALLTEGIIGGFLPLVFAACDAVLVCESPQVHCNAWARVQLGLAYAMLATSPSVYEVDSRLVV